MPDTPGARLTVGDFCQKIRGEVIPLNSHFSYFATSNPFGEEDVRDYLEDPIAALPPSVTAVLPKYTLLLVPFLEKANGKDRRDLSELIVFERPADGRELRSVEWGEKSDHFAAFAVEEMELADYHFELYRRLAAATAVSCTPEQLQDYFGLLREELNTEVHGEVDDASWQSKQGLLRRQKHVRRDTKAFREYAMQSFIDTLTLYLHGICCDIDVEPGPRQIPSRHLLRRLRLLQAMFPPPPGYAVFPDELDQQQDNKPA